MNTNVNETPNVSKKMNQPYLAPSQGLMIIYDNWPPFRKAVSAFRECVDTGRAFTPEETKAVDEAVSMAEDWGATREDYAIYLADIAFIEYYRKKQVFNLKNFLACSYVVMMIARRELTMGLLPAEKQADIQPS